MGEYASTHIRERKKKGTGVGGRKGGKEKFMEKEK